MKPLDLARMQELERQSNALEPDAAEREALTQAVLERTRGMLARTPAPAYAADEGSADALAKLPILPEAGDDALAAALDFVTRHVALHGHSTWAPGFLAYVPGGNLCHATLAEFLGAVMNPFTGHVVPSPAGIRIENQVLKWLASLVGYPPGAAGNLTSGGSIANLSAIATAREALGVKARDVERTVVYLSEQAHHCVAKGLRVAGLGECALRHVPLDERFRMIPDALASQIAEDERRGLRPWLVVASAGTTDAGAVDPFDAIAEIATRHGLWFHVDAAYGGMFCLCQEGRRILKGIERSDSVVIDPHKGMFIPYGVGAVLVKNRAAMMAAHDFEAHYVRDDLRRFEEVSPTEHSIELSRPFRGLRLWLPLQALGTAPFAAALEEKLLLARYAWEKVRALDQVEVGPSPDLSIFVFRVVPSRVCGRSIGDSEVDALNVAVENAFLADGRVLLSSTTIGGRRYLRFAVLAPATHRETIDFAVELLAEKIRALT